MMKSSEAIIGEILELESQINSLNERITDLQKKKARAENEHTKLIQHNLSHNNLKRGSPGDLWERVLEHGLRADALQRAKLDLEAKLDQAHSHLALARLFESIIPHIEDIEPGFLDNLKAIENGINALNEKLNSLAWTIDIFLEEAGNPLDAIESLLKNPLLAGLSLKAFFEGKIKQAIPHENDRFIEALGRRYLQMANGLPKLRDIEEAWMSLSNRLDALARQAQGLIPHRLKYIPAPPAKPRQELGSSMRILPKPPARALTKGQREAKAARKADGIYR